MRRSRPLVLVGLIAMAAARRGAPQEAPLFADGSAAAGLAVPYDNGARGRLELLAIMGPGAALFDYDGDGDLDLFLPRGETLPGDPPVEGRAEDGGGRLLRNDLQVSADGRLAAHFVDVTTRAGIRTTGYAMAVAVGDYDADGAPDLLGANLGADELWRNRGDGTFVEATPPVLRRAGWSSGGSFFDADGDGDLDLYVVEYVEPVPAVRCYAESSRPDFCGPAAYRPLPDRLLRNDGGGSAAAEWTDVSVAAGITRAAGPGLGVVAADVDGDGRIDLHVANDGQPNFLWRNRGDGSFADDALLAGTALSRDGLARAGMGVDVGDADGDGDEDFFVTNLTGEGNTLYVRGGDAFFEDRTAEAGLSSGSIPWTGFGTAFVDADLDGWLDLLVVNGAVRLVHAAEGIDATAESGSARLGRSLAQPGHLYRNLGGGRFVQAPRATAGEALSAPAASRGLAVGDVDGDGDADAVVTSNVAPARMLLGQAPARASWIGVAPCAGTADAPWLARRVVVEAVAPAAGLALPPLARRPHRDGSYASARDPRVVAGLGESVPVAVEVRSRAGSLRWRQPPARRYLVWCPGEVR